MVLKKYDLQLHSHDLYETKNKLCLQQVLICNLDDLKTNNIVFYFQLSETHDYDEKKKIRLALRQLRQQTRGMYL